MDSITLDGDNKALFKIEDNGNSYKFVKAIVAEKTNDNKYKAKFPELVVAIQAKNEINKNFILSYNTLVNALEYIKKLNELLTWDTMKTDVGVLHDLYTNLLVDLKNEIDSILNTTLDGNVNSLKSMESAIKNPGSN